MTADSPAVMGKVFTALAVSVDGFITGRGPGPGQGLGDGGILFGWYFDGDTPSQLLDGLYADLLTSIEAGIESARALAGGRDIEVMGAASSRTCPPTSG